MSVRPSSSETSGARQHAPVGDVASQSLELVTRELGATLNEAQRALEDYVQGRGLTESLHHCRSLLHLARGALRIVEVHGAALLAEEMEQVCDHLVAESGRRNRDEAIEALSRAMVQLPVYLERVLSGGRDIALVLLPLLNDLRAVRGRPLLSEGTLLLLNLSPQRNAHSPDTSRPPPPTDLVEVARQVRPAFQLALLGIIKGENVTRNLERLAQAAGQLEEAARADAVHQLWWVVGGVLEALLDGGLEASVTVKRLLGQADRQIKRLIAEGETRIAAAAPLDLLNNLLYYVARARSNGAKVEAIRASFALSELLPGDDEVATARESLSGPSIKLMHTVAAAIKDDLARVKDVLDIHVRTGSEDVSALAPQLDMLKKIADTLGVLGLGELRGDIQNEIRQLGGIVSGGHPVDEATLLSIASTLLRVEDNIDQQLVRMASPSPAAVVEGVEAPDTDYREVTTAVLRECTINLARVKEAMTAALANAENPAMMDEVPVLLRGINAGLLMLGKERAVRVVENIGRVLKQRLRPGRIALDAEQTDRLADAVVSLEYYMETLAVGRSDPWYMLDNAESCLSRLLPRGTPAEDTGVRAAAPEPALQSPPAPQRPAAAVPPQVMAASQGDRPDPELLEVFIEEAKEELVSLARSFPAWRRNPADAESLVSVRRSFHTLKGSGRMVGAQMIGEFAWSVEKLLNRLINQTLQRNDAMLDFLGEAISSLPQLIEQLELGIRPQADFRMLMKQAEAFANDDPAAAAMLAEIAPPETATPQPAPEDTTGRERMDPVLREIFLKETRGHVETVRSFLAEADAAAAPLRPSEQLYRACHTLLGSSRMAELASGEALAAPMEHYVRSVMSAGAAVTPAGRAALAKGCAEIEQMMAALADERPIEVDEPALLAAFAQPQAELDAAATSVPTSDSGQWQTISEQAPDVTGVAAELPAHLPAEPAAADDFDPELAAIFSEEAGEILEQADELLARWSPSQGADVVELQRLLHTLKGGARMAGLVSMGDLSHEMESLLEGLAAGRIQADAELPLLLQRSVDTLHSMRDSLDAGHQLRADHALLDALAAAAAGRASEVPEAAPAEAPVSAEPPVEQPPVEQTSQIEADALEPRRPREEEIADSISGLTALLDEIDAPVAPKPEAPAGETHAPEAPVSDDTTVEVPEVTTTGDSDIEDWLPEEGEAQPPTVMDGPEDSVPEYSVPEYFADERLPEEPAPEDSEAPEVSESYEVSVAQDVSEPQNAEAREDSEAPAEPAQEIAAQSQHDDAETQPAAPRTRSQAAERQEFARIDAELLDDMLNSAGEISIFHSRLNRQVGSIEFHLGELSQTATRMREQLRALEAETERQILHRHHEDSARSDDFDPLELDRYSTLQQLSRALAESVSDVSSINDLLHTLSTDADTLLVQQGRVTLQLQDSLMRTRMVPFQRHVTRLARLVRQTAGETGKRAELVVKGATGELDRQVLEHMLPPLEHLLRNAVIHGIESPAERHAAHKPETGEISVHMRRDGSEVVIDVADDGAGINTQAIRAKAMEQGLLKPGERLSDEAAKEMILRPGFSTATQLTQSAGRGVGMDVVASQVQKLGGSLRIESKRGQGTRFIVRLPYTLAITQALIVKVGDETFALPLPTVEGIARISRDELLERLTDDDPRFEYAGQSFRLQHLGLFVGGSPSRLPEDDTAVPVILVRAAEHSTALITDELMGSREIVVKTLGPQITGIPGVSGATILGDGSIVVILDVGTLVRAQRDELLARPMAAPVDARLLALVVDDSITVRRVTQRLLERNGMRVMTAKDGMDAITALQEARPDIILLDIEMPRMDGYQFASHVRNDPRVADVPIIMITSRSSEKHRARAIEVGVNDYLSKPYQESQLLNAIAPLVRRDMS